MPDTLTFDEAIKPATIGFDEAQGLEPEEEGRETWMPTTAGEAGRLLLNKTLHPLKALETSIEQFAIQTGMASPGSRLLWSPARQMETPVKAIPRIPQQDSKLAQVGAGAVNAVTDFVNFFQTPEGVATFGIGALPRLAQKYILGNFAVQMARQSPQQIYNATQHAKAGNYQEATTEALSGAGGAVLSTLLAKHVGTPEPVKSAGIQFEPTTPEENAIHRESAEVLPPVPPQPGEGAGKVPVEKGGEEAPKPREETLTPPAAPIDLTPEAAQKRVAWREKLNPIGPQVGSRWGAIENTYIAAKAAQEALPDVPLKDIYGVTIKKGSQPGSPVVDHFFVSRDKFLELTRNDELQRAYPPGQFSQQIEPGFEPYRPRKGEPSYEQWLRGERPAVAAPEPEPPPTPPPTPPAPPEPPAGPIEFTTELTRNRETLNQVFLRFVKGEELSPVEIALVQRLNREDPAAYRYLMQLALLRPGGMNEVNARIAQAEARLQQIEALKKQADPIDAKLARGEPLTEAETIRRETIRQRILEIRAEMQKRAEAEAPPAHANFPMGKPEEYWTLNNLRKLKRSRPNELDEAYKFFGLTGAKKKLVFLHSAAVNRIASIKERPQTPAGAAGEAQVEVAKVAGTEGKRSAQDIKDELITEIQKRLQTVPSDVYDVPPEQRKVTIEIPGDGTFTVWNTVEALSELLKRAKALKTDAKAPGVPKAAIKNSATAIAKSKPPPGEEPPPPPAPEPPPPPPAQPPGGAGAFSDFVSRFTDTRTGNTVSAMVGRVPGQSGQGAYLPTIDIATPSRVGGSSNHGDYHGSFEQAQAQLKQMLERAGYSGQHAMRLKKAQLSYSGSWAEGALERQHGYDRAEHERFKQFVGQIEGVLSKTAEQIREKGPPPEFGNGPPQYGQWVKDTDIAKLPKMVSDHGEFWLVLKWAGSPRQVIKASELAKNYDRIIRGKEGGGDYLREVSVKEDPFEPPQPRDPPGAADVEHDNHGDIVTGLPPGVPDRGPTFKEQLYAAAQRLKAYIRSKVNMRAGWSGFWKRTQASDGIYVRDVDNQRTTAHELGHHLDATLFDGKAALEFSKQSLLTRLDNPPGVTKQELFNELKSISELMRGPIQGTPAQIKYRQRAAELIADFFSLYAHDAARARAMAPKWTAGFERALDNHPDTNVRDTVRQIVAGNVEPVPPERPMGGETTRPVEVSEKIDLTPSGKTPPREHELAVAAEGIVTEAPRKLKAEEAKARIVERDVRKLVPNHQDRLTVGAFIEGIGNITIAGDTIDAVKARMTDAMKEAVKKLNFAIEKQRQKINEYLLTTTDGEYIAFLPNYLTHIYLDSKSKIQSAMARWARESPNARKRKLPTLKEGVDYGLTPRTQDPAALYSLYAYVNWRVATNLKAIANAFDLRLADGSPAIVAQKDAPEGWHVTDHPLLQRIYARKSGDKTMLWRGGVAVHPDLWRPLQQLLDRPTDTTFWRAYDAINALMRASAFSFSFFHHFAIGFAGIATMMRPQNPLRGLFRILERDPISGEPKLFQFGPALGYRMMQFERFVEEPLRLGNQMAYSETESFQRTAIKSLGTIAAKVKDVPYLGKAAEKFAQAHEWWQRLLWEKLHDSLKILAYWDLKARWMENAPPGTNAEEVGIRINSLLNDAFGGQEWETKFWLSPTMRKWAGRVLLAPNWTLSTIRSVPGVSDAAAFLRSKVPLTRFTREAPPHYTEGNAARANFWKNELIAIAAAQIAAQYAIYTAFGNKDKGDKAWMWENEADPTNPLDARTRVDYTPLMRMAPWHDPNDRTRYYANMGKRPGEIVRWSIHPEQELLNKVSRPVAEVIKQLTGMEGPFETEWKRDHLAFLESVPARSKSLGKQFLPFSFSGILGEGSTTLAFTLPSMRGMTTFKTRQAFEDIYRLQAEPTRVKALFHGYPLQAIRGVDINSMLDQITEAAARNGVSPIPLRTRALSIMRGRYYNDLAKAIDSNDEKAAEKAGQALLNLGVTLKGAMESFRARSKLELPQ